MYELYENVKKFDLFLSIIVCMYCQILEHMRICMSFTIFNMCFIFINFNRDTRTFLQVSDLVHEPLGFFLVWKTVAVVTVFQLPLTLVFFNVTITATVCVSVSFPIYCWNIDLFLQQNKIVNFYNPNNIVIWNKQVIMSAMTNLKLVP